MDDAHEAATPAARVAGRIDHLLEGVMQESFQISHRINDSDESPDDEERLAEIERLLYSVKELFELDQLAVLRWPDWSASGSGGAGGAAAGLFRSTTSGCC